jgi:amino acid adenylation domain-containing protein
MGNLNIKSQLQALISKGITLEVAGDKLLVKGEVSALEDSWKDFLKSHKTEIIGLIKKQAKARPPITKRQPGGEIPLSYAQQRLWMIDQIGGGSAQYNSPIAVKVTGDINYEVLERVFTSLLIRHESLRTYFLSGEQGGPHQVIRPLSEFKMPVQDLRALDVKSRELRIAELVRREQELTFDLSSDLMLRVSLLKVADDEQVLLATLHHIASDEWSSKIMLKEIAELYNAFLHNEPDPLPPLRIQYADYAVWQRNWLQGDVLDDHYAFWEKQLQGLPAAHGLPMDRPRPEKQTFSGDVVVARVDDATCSLLKNLCKSEGATLFMGLHTAFSILLARYSNETDIVVGTPIVNREQAEVAGLIGFFVNTLVLRSDLSGDPSLVDCLRRNKAMLLDAYAYQQMPFEQIAERLQSARNLNVSPLFQVMLLLHAGEPAALELPGLKFSALKSENRIVKFDLILSATECSEGLELHWQFNTDLFDKRTIARMSENFGVLLGALLSAPDASVFKVPMLGDAERSRLLYEFNDTAAAYPADKCIHQIFEAQVERNPDVIALTYEGGSLSFGELNRRANRLARYLNTERHVGPDCAVGVCMERSPEMIVALLGILKAGGAYVPIDPDYPQQRISYLLDNADLTVLVTQERLLNQLQLPAARAICLDAAALLATLSEQPDVNPSCKDQGLLPHHLAYVIYTSGTTGLPKGVQQTHRTLVNLAYAQKTERNLCTPITTLQFASLSFDVSIQEIVTAWFTGSKLVLITEETRKDFQKISEVIKQNSVGRLFISPSAGRALFVESHRGLDSLEEVIFAGEPLNLTENLAEQLEKIGCRITNHYGPTETHVATSYEVAATDYGRLASIGAPFGNVQVHVLSDALELVPVGVAGEIYIAGNQLARGYHGNVKLTQERFISNPFSDEPSALMYRTGDLARWLDNGTLEFLGRRDDQVKIRGFRIELGEIEAVLNQHKLVKEAVVVARESAAGDKYLAAYVVPDLADANEPREGAGSARYSGEFVLHVTECLRQSLGAELPAYMIPSAFVLLGELPLTTNGKLDKRALPEPLLDSLPGKNTVAPRSDTEAKLFEIWKSVLGHASFGIYENFFDVGGHSLSAIGLASRIGSELSRKLSISEIFQNATIESLGKLLDGKSRTAVSTNKPFKLRDGKGIPLFLVHPPGGGVESYAVLARVIPGEMPIYGLQLTDVDVEEFRNVTIEAMAMHHVGEIRKIQRGGPYRIAGFSGGGTVAYEVAYQLLGSDEEVGFLGLIDTPNPAAESVEQRWTRLEKLNEKPISFVLRSMIEFAGTGAGAEYVGALERSAVDVDPEVFAVCLEKGLLPMEMSYQELVNLSVRFVSMVAATYAYDPPPLSIKVHLFASSKRAAMQGDSLGWDKVPGDRMAVQVIEGEHMTLLKPPNVERLGAVLNDAMSAAERTTRPGFGRRRDLLHQIQRGRNVAAPVFCIPGAGATIASFLPLVDALGADFRIYGFHHRGMDPDMVPHSNVESAARSYLSEMLAVAPQGPFRLVGHSFGGLVAFEIACQLEAMGKAVEPLVLIDTDCPRSFRQYWQTSSRAEILMELFALYEQASGVDFAVSVNMLERWSSEEQIRLLSDKMKKAGFLSGQNLLKEIEAMVRVFAVQYNSRYIPARSYQGPVLLLSASHARCGETDPPARWRDHARDFTQVNVDSNHMTILQAPAVRKVSSFLLEAWSRRSVHASRDARTG